MSSSFQNCPKCGRLIPADATLCPQCGGIIEIQTYDTSDGNNSGLGSDIKPPLDVSNQFSWGAFFFNWIWCIIYKKYMFAIIDLILCFVPIMGPLAVLIFNIYLGKIGNTLAWQTKRYQSVEEFHQIHKKWATCGLYLSVVIPIVIFIILLSILPLKLIDGTPEANYRLNAKSAWTMLNMRAKLKNEKLNDFSAERLTDYFYQTIIGGDKEYGVRIVSSTGTTYTFRSDGNCISDGCYIEIDTNGEDEPNKKWTESAHPSDIIIIPIRNKDGYVKIYKPDVLK